MNALSAADQGPNDARRNAADERRPQIDMGVGNERVHEREDQRDDGVRQELTHETECPSEMREGVQPVGGWAVSAEASSSSATANRIGPAIMTLKSSVKRRAEAARPVDAPDEIEARLHLLNGAKGGVEEHRETDRTEQFAAHVLDELHDGFGERTFRMAQGAEELMQDESQVGVRAEALEDRKEEHHQRHQGQECRVRQTHGLGVDVTRQPVAQQGGRIAQRVKYRPPGSAQITGFSPQFFVEMFKRHEQAGPRRSGGQQFERLAIIIAGARNDLRRQVRRRGFLVPVHGFQIVAHKLLVEARRADAGPVRPRPEARRIGRQGLIDKQQIAACRCRTRIWCRR